MREKAIDLIQKYVEAPWTSVEAFADPGVAGVYAVRATWSRRKGKNNYKEITQDFLVNVYEGEDSVEEVQFSTWPPTSGQPKFFL